MSQVQGAFSLVMLTNDRLIAVRDPHGFRPLALGRLDDAVVVCSETCAMDLIGATYVRDVEPGEVLIVSRRRHPVDQAVSAGAAGALHFRARLLRAAGQLRVRTQRQRGPDRVSGASWRASSRSTADVVVPVPDSGVCAAMGFAEESGIPLRMGLIRNHYVGRTFIQPQAVDPAFRREGEAESGPEHPRRPAGGSRGRFDRARHDEPEDRQDGAGRGCEGSARADQLSADDFAVFLRRRHAAQSELIAATHTLEEIRTTSKPTASRYLSLEGC